MRIHIEHQAAAVLLAVVPARALRRMQLAVEHPPAAVEPRRQDAAEEAGVAHLAQLVKARQVDLVLHGRGLDARGLRGAHDRHRLRGRSRRSASPDRCACRPRSPAARAPAARRSPRHRSRCRSSCRRASRPRRPTTASPPCAAASAASLSGLRPSSTGSGMRRSPLRSGNPPSLRIASTERIRCWLVPRRPVTPSIATRSVLVAM